MWNSYLLKLQSFAFHCCKTRHKLCKHVLCMQVYTNCSIQAHWYVICSSLKDLRRKNEWTILLEWHDRGKCYQQKHVNGLYLKKKRKKNIAPFNEKEEIKCFCWTSGKSKKLCFNFQGRELCKLLPLVQVLTVTETLCWCVQKANRQH